MKRNNRNNLVIIIIIIILCIIIGFVAWALFYDPKAQYISFTKLYNLMEKKTISQIAVDGFSVTAYDTKGNHYYTNMPNDPWWIQYMVHKNIDVSLYNVSSTNNVDHFMRKVVELLFSVIQTFLWIFFIYNINTRSDSKKSLSEKPNVKFSDVSGLKEEKQLLQEVVFAMKNVERFEKYKCKPLRGVLLYGPPGNGKTLLGKAVATECDAEFFYMSASEFVEIYVGVGPKKVRTLFSAAREAGNSIIFIDEADALGSRNRGGYNSSEHHNTINQILVEMDGIDDSGGNVIVILATNNMDRIDEAILRKGRIDRQIEIKLPDLEDRLDLLQLATKDISLNNDVDLKKIARGTIGFSRADLVSLVNETKILAMRENNYGLRMVNFEKAKDQVILGTQKDINKVRPKDLHLTAHHECGHAYMQYYYRKYLDPIYKATIVPHGKALGVVIPTPDDGRVSYSKIYIECEIQVFFAGRICEEIFYGLDAVTSGCSSDIKQARKWAEYYVRYGMNNDYGLKYFTEGENISEAENAQIFDEVAKLMKNLEQEARYILERDKHLVQRLANALLVAETLTGQEIEDILTGKRSLPIICNKKKIITIK